MDFGLMLSTVLSQGTVETLGKRLEAGADFALGLFRRQRRTPQDLAAQMDVYIPRSSFERQVGKYLQRFSGRLVFTASSNSGIFSYLPKN